MTKRNFNLRNTVAIAICLAGVVLFSNCNKNKDDEHIMGMTYHDNAVIVDLFDGLEDGNFTPGNSSSWMIVDGRFTVTDFGVTSGQDPDHNLAIGKSFNMNAKHEFVFVLGRKASKEVANSFNAACPPAHNTFNHTADELNFWMKGTLEIRFLFSGTFFIFPNTYFAQGHSGATNNWWFGNDAMTNSSAPITLYDIFKNDYVTFPSGNNYGYISPAEYPNTVFKFQRGTDGGMTSYYSTVKLIGVYYKQKP